MSNEEEKLIKKTLAQVKKTLKESYSKYEAIEKLGLEYQEKGNKLVKYARMGKEYIEYQLTEGDKYVKAFEVLPELRITLDGWDKSGQLNNNWLNKAERNLVKGIDFITNGSYYVSSATSTTSAKLESTTLELIGIQYTNPDINLFDKYDFNISIEVNRDQIENDLDKELEKIDSNLPNRRKGAWETYNSASSDKLSQAANSMRNILSCLISMWASNDDVKSAIWWKPVEDTKEGVSTWQRLRYLLFGPGNIVDKNLLDRIGEEVNKIYKSNEVLNKTAHGSAKYKELVEANMRLIEDTLHSIIYMRKIHFKP